MNRATLAALLLAAASSGALAQQPADIPKHRCEPKPQMPMRSLMAEPGTRKKFQREVDEYKNCMKAYADERGAAAKAHTDAGNAAINEYNETMKALQEAQKSN